MIPYKGSSLPLIAHFYKVANKKPKVKHWVASLASRRDVSNYDAQCMDHWRL